MTPDVMLQMEREIAPKSSSFKAYKKSAPRFNFDESVEEITMCFVAVLAGKGIGHEQAQAMVRAEYLRRSLVLCKGNKCAAARMMGVHRNTLNRMAK